MLIVPRDACKMLAKNPRHVERRFPAFGDVLGVGGPVLSECRTGNGARRGAVHTSNSNDGVPRALGAALAVC